MTLGEVEWDEPSLVDAARRGDRRAFELLVRRHQDAVYSLAVRLVGPDLAPDVAQEAFVRAWRGLARFRGDARFSTWLHRITVNTAWTHRRRSARHQAQPIEDVYADSRPGPAAAAEAVELRRNLRLAIGMLSEANRIVLVLRDVEGWSTGEVAEHLGLTKTTVKVRLHRARARVRELLEEAPWER
ncbi:MAG TPA: sigma-70 family RNA polymerase sigma factor [Acidimicrobiia bacterium]|nr:sigma-70 family RNA polymerase sigma factor [Acidimicrobiia bacterium]